jgi:hypothetical protein
MADGNGYHARTFWIGAQLDLGSLLGDAGDEAASLDIFKSLEASLHNNHLAVGEWNQAIDQDLKTRTVPEAPTKDTPRFPPYPRYKCAWEYLVRILGLKMDEQYLYLQPFKTVDFRIHEFPLAGVKLTVTVAAGWSQVLVNGSKVTGLVRLDRRMPEYRLEFVK